MSTDQSLTHWWRHWWIYYWIFICRMTYSLLALVLIVLCFLIKRCIIFQDYSSPNLIIFHDALFYTAKMNHLLRFRKYSCQSNLLTNLFLGKLFLKEMSKSIMFMLVIVSFFPLPIFLSIHYFGSENLIQG